jgi:hypothetical protein
LSAPFAVAQRHPESPDVAADHWFTSAAGFIKHILSKMTTRNCFTFLLMLLIAVFRIQCNAFSVGFTTASRPAAVAPTALSMTVLTYNGKKKDFKAGSPLSTACQQLGVKVTYSCKK